MDSACPKELVTEILSDSDHSTKVAPTTLSLMSVCLAAKSKSCFLAYRYPGSFRHASSRRLDRYQ